MTTSPAACVDFRRHGLLIVISSPSGAGKTSLCRRLIAADPKIKLSVSAATRPRRPSERDGVDYLFVSAERFAAMRDADAFLESAEVFGHRYGSPRRPVEAWRAQGHDVLFDIDGQGARQIAANAGHDDLVRIFLLPPDIAALRTRLRGRAEDSAAVIADRMAHADREIAYWRDYDYVLVNRDIDDTLAQTRRIVDVERHRRSRLIGLEDHVRALRRDLDAKDGGRS